MKTLILISIVVLSCNPFKKAGKEEELQRFMPGIVVDKSGLDGCTYLIQINDTLTLEPLNLPDSLKIDNLPVWVDYERNDSVMSTCMAGRIVDIIEIKKREIEE